MPRVDAVVVSYNSRNELRACVAPLAAADDVNVVVVDNASGDASLDAVLGLPVLAVQLRRNGGFAHGCNAGWRLGDAPFVLFVNPDAVLRPDDLGRLARVLEENPRIGAIAPRIVGADGGLHWSQRRFPRLRSVYAQALFLHRLMPSADELVRDEHAYARPGSPDWVSGACILVRRDLLERLGGFDEGFFMYCEDIDLCRRLRDAGYDVRFEPAAVAVHVGGASTPAGSMLPVLASSRLHYARKHRSAGAAALERLGLALSALTHAVAARGGRSTRRGHARSFRLVASRRPASLS
jgi:N-acetylglucosaminyl-diphospho-decaprenol L-rhamnosyltransferase